ncbi:hypothetical protein BC829DRAFT_189883 [Chytridium lagenaria]|nr:hypothetical protein BC829DRAFT_189883 [Chytridium lagenaria]
MDARELQIAITINSRPLVAIAIENRNGEYIFPSNSSIKIALSEMTAIDVNPETENVIAIDSPTPGAYPISLITNFVIRKDNISNDIDVTMWTLRFLWWVHTTPSLVTLAESKNFVSLQNTPAGEMTLRYLREYKYKGNTLFGKSICD